MHSEFSSTLKKFKQARNAPNDFSAEYKKDYAVQFRKKISVDSKNFRSKLGKSAKNIA